MFELIVVAVAAVLTSILSAVAGLGGGVILLLVIAQLVPPTTAIPLQGAIQLVSNGSRASILRAEINRSAVFWSSLLVLPATLLGVAVARSLPEDAIRMVLAVFVLVLAWRPQLLKPTPRGISRQAPNTGIGNSPLAPITGRGVLMGVGATSGFLNATVGASGPVTSPFYKAATATHVAFVATAAATQVIAHISKLIAFSASGWRIGEHADLIAVGVVGVVVGSAIGTRLLPSMAPARLDGLFKLVLTALAVRLLVTALT